MEARLVLYQLPTFREGGFLNAPSVDMGVYVFAALSRAFALYLMNASSYLLDSHESLSFLFYLGCTRHFML